jgi:hypothetical protein
MEMDDSCPVFRANGKTRCHRQRAEAMLLTGSDSFSSGPLQTSSYV